MYTIIVGNMSEIKRLGILGGTFDPIHFGHLRMAEEAKDAFGLERVVFVTAGVPYHKESSRISDARHRLAMCKLAVSDNPLFEPSDLEVRRPGPTYSIDTVKWFRNAYPALDALYFITGADSLLSIRSWRAPDELSHVCNLVAATRPGFSVDLLEDTLDADFLERITFLPIPGLDISSTDIRRHVRSKRSVRYLLPDSVIAYIEEHGLYRQ